MAIAMECNVRVELPAATPTMVVIRIRGALNWGFTVTNAGANPVTAATLERCPGRTQYTDPEAWNPASLPLLAGASSYVQGTSEPLTFVRLTLTSALGTEVVIAGSGQ